MIELISLDLDDTLWDAGPVLERAERAQYQWIRDHAPRVAARYGIAEMRQMRRQLAAERPDIGHDFTQLRIVALADLLDKHGYCCELAREAIDVFVEVRSQVSLYPEVAAVLIDLARDFRLAALTNGNTDLDKAGVAGFFEFAISPADTGTSKPDPRMLEAVCEKAGVASTAVVHVGDEPKTDIEAAHNAGVRSVWMNRKQTDWPPHFRPPDAEITSLQELRGAIMNITNQLAVHRGAL